mgnify:CR=1 FL=1
MNSFQITIFGIAIIAAYSLAIVGIAYALSRLLERYRWKWWLLAPPALLLMALPWGEEGWIAWHFNEACKDAGVKVYRQVEADGYVYDLSRDTRTSANPGLWKLDKTSLEAFDREGYKFRENMLVDGGVLRVERHLEGLIATLLDKPTARYVLKHSYQPSPYRYEEPIGWKLEKLEYLVLDRETDEVLGRDTRFIRFPSFAEMLWLRYFGPANLGCSGPLDDPDKQKRKGMITSYVIIPQVMR